MISPSCHSPRAAEAGTSAVAAAAPGLARATLSVALATVLSRVLGFVRDAVIAWYFGAGYQSDAFLAAFRIPNLFRRVVGEGTLNAAVVPLLTEARWKGGDREAHALVSSAARSMALLLLAVCGAGMLAAPWIVTLMTPGFSASKLDLTITLVRLMLPYLLAAGMLALFMGALNVYGSFAAPALAPAWLNIAMIASLGLIAPQLERPVIALALGVLIGGAVQLIWPLPFLRRYRLHPWRAAPSGHPALKRMARLMVPALLGGAVYQINILAGMMLASLLPEGSISYLYYADRLVEFPLGVVAMAASTAILPSMARDAAAGDPHALRVNFEYGFRLVSFVSVPAAAGLILLGEPIVTLLFARGEFNATDVRLTVQAVSYYAIGLWAFSAVRIVVAAFFALQDSRTPVRAAVFSILANLALGWVLMQPLAHGGMALATSLASVLNLLPLLAALHRKLGGMDLRAMAASLGKSLLSTAVMAVAVLGVSRLMIRGPGQTNADLVLGLTLSIATGVSIYLAAGLAFGSPEARGLWGALRGSVRVR